MTPRDAIKKAVELMISVAQNDYMIDSDFLPTGQELLAAAALLEKAYRDLESRGGL